MKINEFFHSVKSFVKGLHLTTSHFVLGIVVLFTIGLLSTSVTKCRNERKIYETNLKALTDSVSYYRNSAGKLVAEKTALMVDVNELNKYNSELYEKIKEFGKKPKDFIGAVSFDGDVVSPERDTVYILDEAEQSFGVDKDFAFNDEWRDLEGVVGYHQDTLGLKITKDVVRFNYTVGIDKDNKVYIKSDNPYVMVNEIEGFTVPTAMKEKQKRWGVGPQVGVGLDVTRGKLSPTIGIGVQYNLFKF